MSSVQAPFDATQFRTVIGHFMSGVAVITTRSDDHDFGMTASAVCSLSLEPPMLLACLHQGAPTQQAICATGRFGVSILAQQQDAIAQRFASSVADRFDGVPHRAGTHGQPLLDDALAHIECDVAESVEGGSHRVFLGLVRHAEVRGGAPLAYYRGRFGRLELAADEEALARVRELVLFRERPLAAPLDAAALGADLELPESSVSYALARLEADGLVTRTADGYHQVPLDVAASDAAFEAKHVIDRGAAALAVERADDAGVQAALALAHAIPRGDGPRDPELVARYVAANEAFHEHMIGLSGNDALLDAYRRLQLPVLLPRILVRGDAASDALTADHLAIAEALAARDLPRLLATIADHNERGKRAHRDAILEAGGQV